MDKRFLEVQPLCSLSQNNSLGVLNQKQAVQKQECLRDQKEKRKEERIQAHIAQFGHRATFNTPATGWPGSSCIPPRDSGEPVLSELQSLSTSTYWFKAPPSREDRIGQALAEVVPVQQHPHALRDTVNPAHEICAICACELFDEECSDTASADANEPTAMDTTVDVGARSRSVSDASHTSRDSGCSEGCDASVDGCETSPAPAAAARKWPTLHLFISITGSASSAPVKPSAPERTPQRAQGGRLPPGVEHVVAVRACGHCFHKECIQNAFKYHTRCPVCLTELAPQIGPQPHGTMRVEVMPTMACPGHEAVSKGTIVINYSFPR